MINITMKSYYAVVDSRCHADVTYMAESAAAARRLAVQQVTFFTSLEMVLVSEWKGQVWK